MPNPARLFLPGFPCQVARRDIDFDVTMRQVRPIEASALNKLRHPSRSERLRAFIDAD